MSVVVCLDKFRGSATAAQACAWLAAGIRAAGPGVPVVERPLADGGEGTVEALAAAGYSLVRADVMGPVAGMTVSAAIAVRGSRAVVELAQASGLALIPGGAPLTATTYGTGQLVRAALDLGCTQIVLAVGGSATTDGGAGLLTALGASVRDASGAPLPPGGGHLADAASLDLSGLDPRVPSVDVVLASDVDNPLLGPDGAARVFGPQKGAGPAQIERLEAGLARFADLMTARTGKDHTATPGAGAAGGTGFAALAALAARPQQGSAFMLDELDLPGLLRGAALCVVGEGRFDGQSLRGKAPCAAASLASRAHVPVTLVAGEIALPEPDLASLGITAAHSLLDVAETPRAAFERTEALLHAIGERIGSDLTR
ncbi:glycerate kinase [Spirillospora albida]|uniref:glycerate kinase n=1 Tax=Spirillospora albida TaxID=58123 RepID=UPI0004BFAE66|nr:glycerate kinase [Spirillospora albida]